MTSLCVMASSMAEVFLKFSKTPKPTFSPLYNVVRHSSKRPKCPIVRGTIKYRNLIEPSCRSLEARGFLRFLKPYDPPKNVSKRVMVICQSLLGKNYSAEKSFSREEKFSVLNECFKELDHSVPNSLLYKINNVNDVISFYETPVSTTTPLDEFKNQELPPNLHIQYEYHRFDPETDTKFKGVTAFPKSSTIVTGLKYKEKYKSVKQDSPYRDSVVHFDKNL